MDPLVYISDEGTVEIVNLIWESSFGEGKDLAAGKVIATFFCNLQILIYLIELGYELPPQPPLPPVLAPCDFFLFPNLKKFFMFQL